MKNLLMAVSILTLTILSTSKLKAQDSLWAGNFGPTGLFGPVKVLKHWGDSLVLGGQISGVANSSITTKEFIIFDKVDRSWKRQTVGPSGTNAEVRALEVLGSGNLLLGGDFSFFRDGKTMRHLAVLDKFGNYSSLTGDSTDGFDGPINALLYHNNRLYIGGEFTQVGSLSVPGFIIWDEDNGFMLPNGVIQTFTPDPPVVHTFDYSGAYPNKFLIGGVFDYEELSYASNLVFFNMATASFETTPFSPLGPVYTIFTDTSATWADKIVVGGEFSDIYIFEIGVTSCTNIAILNLPDSSVTIPPEDLNGPVFTIKKFKGSSQESRLLVGGEFDSAGSLASGPLAVWKTTSNEWRNFATHPKNGAVYAIDDTRSFIAGDFDYINDTNRVNSIYQMPNFIETSWRELGDGLYRTGIGNIAVSDVEAGGYQKYYACGNFNYAGARLVNYIARWNGTNWEALGDGLNNSANELLVNGDTVYVAGTAVNNASGVPVNQIAMWDGVQWSAMGEGVPGASIMDMEMDTLGNLYVCGSGLFTAGNVSVTGVAMWDGSEWSAVGGPIVSSAQLIVFDMYIDTLTNNLYVCGQFETVDNMSSPGAAMWNGASWVAIGDEKLRNLGSPRNIGRSPDGDIIVAGSFNNANLVYRDPFGDWYSYAGGLLSGYTTDMLTYGCDLFISGDPLQYIDNVQVNNFGRWDGIEWVGFDDGTNFTLLAMSQYSNNLLLGGTFKVAGGKYAYGFTIWKGLRNPNTEAGLHVYAPSYGDTLEYGTVTEIKWDTSTTVDAVTIEVSYDTAKTWQTIHTNVNAKQGSLPWLVPGMDSARGIIRISEAYAPCVSVSGGPFAITADPNLKVNWLKRKTGSYYDEPFTIGYHNWNFGNTKANQWPDSVAKSIPYPDDFKFIPDTVETFPDWYRFVNAFGDDYCYKNGNLNRISPTALEKWKNLLQKWGGSCLGFSKSALLWFKRNSFNTGIFIPEKYLYDFESGDFARNMVNIHWIYQQGTKHRAYNHEVRNYTPMQTLQIIREDMPFNYPRSLSFSWSSWRDKTNKTGEIVDSVWRVSGHNVVPYAIKEFLDSVGIYHIYIYDSNSPTNKSRYVRVDSVNQTWGFPDYNIPDTTSRFVPRLPINEWIGLADDDRKTIVPKQNGSGGALLFASATEDILITDSSGAQIGWINNQEVNTFVGSYPIFPDEPEYLYNYPQGYYLPDGEYRVEISNFEYDKTRISLELPNSTHTYQRNDVDSAAIDNIYFNNGITVVNHDLLPKNVSLTSIVNSAETEYYLKIDSLRIAQNDSMIVNVAPGGTIQIDNFGQAKNYTCILWYADANVDSYTQSLTTISMDGNSSHRMEPVWTNLESGTLEVQVDNNMDSIYEDTIVADVATDVDDDIGQLIPGSYLLAQNYPNPFNPRTTIAFTLPTKSDVRLEVINILGQKIRTLVNTSLTAGEHKIDWDSKTDAGNEVSSGVYFYRLIAGDYISTKKMLLLK